MNIFAAVAPSLFSAYIAGTEYDGFKPAEQEIHDKKPAIDDVICHYLDGTTLKNALNFIDYVRASKMKIKWSAANVWSVRYKSKRVMDIIIGEGAWRVRLAYDHTIPESIFSNRDQENIKALIGVLRTGSSVDLEPTLALS